MNERQESYPTAGTDRKCPSCGKPVVQGTNSLRNEVVLEPGHEAYVLDVDQQGALFMRLVTAFDPHRCGGSIG